MVGEIRDAETGQIAVQSALTGHLVFTTVHANNAFDVLGRFLNMGIEPYNFVSSLNCILAQRLVRILCLHCKKTGRNCPAKRSRSRPSTTNKYKDHQFYEAGGCKECNYTGFRGRKAITEFLDLSDHIREMILEKRPSSELRKAAIAEGMTTLRQSALAKVFAGDTTLEGDQPGDVYRIKVSFESRQKTVWSMKLLTQEIFFTRIKSGKRRIKTDFLRRRSTLPSTTFVFLFHSPLSEVNPG